jgi:eukaryotic-like serine/threonine-protein kinase
VPEMIGTKLDRFELIAELASGGMGTVFLARLGGAGGFQRLYAIKRLHEHLARHPEFIEMFLDEARLAARIHHPNVVPILEIGTNDAGYYLVMEYVEGDTAGHLVHSAAQEGKTVSVRVAVRIVLDVLAGLHAAHEGTDDDGRSLEIVHRDVSPHNILVSVDGVSRITDFGIARAATRLAVTRTGQLKGKIAYMAPEQARSEKIDRRADVFAVGICLWELLARRRLFKADAEGETLNRLLYEPIPSLRTVDPTIPRELDAVCAKALTRDLDKRFATAADFADALESAARSVELLGSHREVAACVSDVLGADISERRADLRAWIADAESRKSMLPVAADSSGDLMDRQRGALVSVYVPPLFDSGTLRGHEGSKSTDKRGSKGRRVLLVGAMLVAGFGAARWWHGRSQASTASSAPPAVPELTSTTVVETAAPPVTTPPSAAPRAPVDSSGWSPPASVGGDGVRAAPGSLSRPPVVAVARPVHPGAAPAQGTAGSPRGATSVPQEMLYNPYR